MKEFPEIISGILVKVMKKQVIYDILIPKLSDEIIDCQIARWLKNVGEYVYEGDVLVELETEKTTVEIESPTDGVLDCIYVFEGEEVIDGERIGIINADVFYEEDEDDSDSGEYDDEEENEDEDELDEDFDDEDDPFTDSDFDIDEKRRLPVYIDSDDEY